MYPKETVKENTKQEQMEISRELYTGNECSRSPKEQCRLYGGLIVFGDQKAHSYKLLLYGRRPDTKRLYKDVPYRQWRADKSLGNLK